MSEAPFTFADVCAGIGGFHVAMRHAGGRCTFYSEIDARARQVYTNSWLSDLDADSQPECAPDITAAAPTDGDVTIGASFDVLTAGFPCQTFSKSGAQRGMEEARGTIFYNIARVIEEKRPRLVMLENVRNLAGPRHTHEWEVIIRTLRDLGYKVSTTPTIFSPHLLPPSLGGTPQVRERVFILGTYVGVENSREEDPGPVVGRGVVNGWDPQRWRAEWVMSDEVSARYSSTAADQQAIEAWDAFVARYRMKHGTKLPGHPIWSDFFVPREELAARGYAAMPPWKQRFVDKNVNLYLDDRDWIDSWREEVALDTFIPSRRKLEWQAGGLESLTATAMQMRPSGIRAKAPTYLPALVAITQTSFIGPRGRRLTPMETARLQGFPDELDFGEQSDPASYKQTGNAVAVGAVWYVFRSHVERDREHLPERLVESVLNAPLNPSPGLLSEAAYEAEAENEMTPA